MVDLLMTLAHESKMTLITWSLIYIPRAQITFSWSHPNVRRGYMSMKEVCCESTGMHVYSSDHCDCAKTVVRSPDLDKWLRFTVITMFPFAPIRYFQLGELSTSRSTGYMQSAFAVATVHICESRDQPNNGGIPILCNTIYRIFN